MNREELYRFVEEEYGVLPEYPWAKSPDNAVFRHDNNKKWFMIVMNVHSSKIGLEGDYFLDIANVKCDPILIGSLINKDGFFRGYHMNKNYWISISLDGKADDEEFKSLIDLSYDLTS